MYILQQQQGYIWLNLSIQHQDMKKAKSYLEKSLAATWAVGIFFF